MDPTVTHVFRSTRKGDRTIPCNHNNRANDDTRSVERTIPSVASRIPACKRPLISQCPSRRCSPVKGLTVEFKINNFHDGTFATSYSLDRYRVQTACPKTSSTLLDQHTVQRAYRTYETQKASRSGTATRTKSMQQQVRARFACLTQKQGRLLPINHQPSNAASDPRPGHTRVTNQPRRKYAVERKLA